ncbi:hypothetical protein [Bacteroides sp.]|uniref:hypothetical protein n=1 Tax=Bacteroides sp. TaxID=29523 RepID=UPI002630CBA6|nr:hypothetical protein [Bacteroides sp.]MDD3038626.1 hypothetical protein [Bacteroides sp.]
MDILSKILDFFSSDKISLTPKIAFPLLVFVLVFFFVDYYGFFYYYSNGEKVEYISKIQETRVKCASDSLMVSHLDGMMNDAINRKSVFKWFTSLFDNEKVSPRKIVVRQNKSDSPWDINKIFPKHERNQLWHTISSSLFWILILIFLFGLIVFSPFIGSENRIGMIIGASLGIGIMSLLIWVTQWLFGFIPVIFDRAYINYILQFMLNLIPIIALTIGSIKESRKKNNL